jgi:hypothetical protein
LPRKCVRGHVHIYPNPLGHTLKSFASFEYEFGIRSKREGDSERGLGKSRNGSTILRMVPEGSKIPSGDIMEVSESEIRSNWFIYGKSEIHQKGETLEGDAHGSGAAWGPSLDSRTL